VLELDRADAVRSSRRTSIWSRTGWAAFATRSTRRRAGMPLHRRVAAQSPGRGELLKDEAGRWWRASRLTGRPPARVKRRSPSASSACPETAGAFSPRPACRRRLQRRAGRRADRRAGGRGLAALSAAWRDNTPRASEVSSSRGVERSRRCRCGAAFGRAAKGGPEGTFDVRFSTTCFRIPLRRARPDRTGALARRGGCKPRAIRRRGSGGGEHFAARWPALRVGWPARARRRALLDAGRQAIRVSAVRDGLGLFDRGLRCWPTSKARPMSRLRRSGRRSNDSCGSHGCPGARLRGSAGAKFDDTPVQVAETLAGDLDDRPGWQLSRRKRPLERDGQFTQILSIAQRMLDLATRCGDDAFEAMAHFAFGLSYTRSVSLRRQMAISSGSCPHSPAGGRASGAGGFDLLSESLAFSASTSLPWAP